MWWWARLWSSWCIHLLWWCWWWCVVGVWLGCGCDNELGWYIDHLISWATLSRTFCGGRNPIENEIDHVSASSRGICAFDATCCGNDSMIESRTAYGTCPERVTTASYPDNDQEWAHAACYACSPQPKSVSPPNLPPASSLWHAGHPHSPCTSQTHTHEIVWAPTYCRDPRRNRVHRRCSSILVLRIPWRLSPVSPGIDACRCSRCRDKCLCSRRTTVLFINMGRAFALFTLVRVLAGTGVRTGVVGLTVRHKLIKL